MAKKQEEQRAGINSNEFNSAISQICDEKGINKDKVMQTVEAALAAAYKKDYGKKSQNIRAEIGGVDGGVKFFLIKEVVDESVREFVEFEEDEEEGVKKVVVKDKKESEEEKMARFNPERDIKLEEALKIKKDIKVGDVIETELETQESYGRVAAQTAKQVIIQRIREAEKDAMYEEYKEKEGEILNGVVQRIEGQNIFIDLGKATGVLFPSEQVRGENYKIGQRLKVYLGKIEADNRGPGIILSRTHPEMVRKLFELEVPEIFSGTVEVKAIAREAGSRTKIAVVAKEEGIDPIGSCVGQKGTRVQAIIDELGGEKIDIIEWNENIEKFITAALSPAKVLGVKIKDEEAKEAITMVPSDQLSLAIGQKGQNVRLAAKLTGWKIDVVGEEGAEKRTKKDDVVAKDEVKEEEIATEEAK
ncbi:MAG: NusA antitermination factor [Candidatus Moranbacteria bacterium GW2011_GWE1_35_17]|nr:MAG: NusA antitermination factor [Candidatus Moranbacteria bacterium GW2011_GWE1_35_17]KKP72494.1 MAG: NusA antitermination factor [Candidatus Moranbacteria bacterium GW2011_GWE2_35_164]KKP84230.1 MAG: NusA antitermination factor [Candidatus Moranbacteria bacterium GW2011_GWF2_35_54]KKP84467.1 MAG: NusA antitermination factor [Candidatus Moranbacteria bacterium GW2011_GWF1_35_5]